MAGDDTLDLLLQGVANVTPQSLIMIGVALVLFYLAIAKDYEPLLLLPIGAGCMLANLPLSPLIADDGMLRVLYDMGIGNELFPLLIFIGIGALTDFGPLLENPRMVLLGAAGQFGIFLTLILALVLGLHPERGGVDRHHRRDRRPDVDLRQRHPRAAPARADHRRRVQLHVAGADHHAADHAAADDEEGAARSACRTASARSAGARASCSRSSSPCWSARWCRSPRR